MQTDIECPYGHGPMVGVSLATVTEAMHRYMNTANKYFWSKGGFFEAQVWEEFSNLNDSVKQQIDLLCTADDDYVSKSAEKFGRERASCWARYQRSAPSSDTQGNSGEMNVQGNQMKNTDQPEQQDSKEGTSADDAESKVEPPSLREAQKALEKYIKVCEEEIREKCDDSWSLLAGGLEMIDYDYKSTRNIIKKAIEAASDNEEDESKKGDRKEAEELLKKLRKIWQDARRIFADAIDEDYDFYDSDLDEESDSGLRW
ncbi:hypothetical protein F5Y10DRAFT_284045 [Nemania abortiva]|nr:hypothetical protein F5Y10DRAFT_284045 [Nemania abortiva]